MLAQEFSRKHRVSSFSFGHSGVFQTPEVRVTTVTLKQSCVKHLGIQEEPGQGVFCTGTHVIPLMHGLALFKTYQSYKNISDSVFSVCLSHELLPLGSLRPKTVSSSHIYTALTVWTEASKDAYLYLCQSISSVLLVQSLSATEWLFTQLHLFSFKGYLLGFF